LQQQKKFDMPILMGVLQHHERLDGSGYPLQTHSDKTHVFARIIAIADVYDAMTSQKNYGVQHSPFDALAEIRRDISSGRIDANYGRAFLEIMRTNLLGEWVALSDGRFCQLVGWGQDEKRMLYLQSVDNERIVLVGDSLIKPIQIIPPQSGNVFL
jgi:HD-GYP domain-containing protein (c-di-GMP phosphodiesterase class II)